MLFVKSTAVKPAILLGGTTSKPERFSKLRSRDTIALSNTSASKLCLLFAGCLPTDKMFGIGKRVDTVGPLTDLRILAVDLPFYY